MKDFAPLRGHSGFWITRQGEIWKRVNITHPERRQWYQLAAHIEKGALRVVVKQKHYVVSRLVYSTFVGRLKRGLVVCHLNGNFQDNRPENLYQGTQKENISHKRAHGTWQSCENHPKATITNKDALNIKKEIGRAIRKTNGHLARGEASRIAGELCLPVNIVYEISRARSSFAEVVR